MNGSSRRGLGELSGTGLVADDLYLMGHHEVTGRTYLNPRAAGLGLSGALLAELILGGNVRIMHGAAVVTNAPEPADGLASAVLDLLIDGGRERAVRDWLAFLSRTSVQDVAHRLQRSGYLTPSGPRWRRREPEWVPVNPDTAFAPLIRARAALDPSRQFNAASAALAGLAMACGLGSRLLAYGPPNARRCLDGTISRLGVDLRQLIAQTQAAVDAAVLSYRA